MKKKNKKTQTPPGDVACLEPAGLRIRLSHFRCVYDTKHGGIETHYVSSDRPCECCGKVCTESQSDGFGAGIRYRVIPHYKQERQRGTFAYLPVWACRTCFIMWDDGLDENGNP